MESYNGPPVRPPSRGERKKTEGSFARRNNWIFIVIIAVLLIAAGGWFLVNKVKTVKNQFTTAHLDSAVDDDDEVDTAAIKVDTSKSKLAGEMDSVFTKSYEPVEVARLNISGGAITYRLKDTTNQLFAAATQTYHLKYQLTSHKEGSVYVMDFGSKSSWNKSHFEGKSDSADIKLNIHPEWEINVNTGAADLDFDLSKYKLKLLKLSGGAGQFVVKVGAPLIATNIDVSTGASEVTIRIPRAAACNIQVQAGLSSNTFNGFTKKDDSHYETPGFGSAKNKIYIKISGGISDYKVEKY